MQRRWLVASLAWAACTAGDDEWAVRPPGGGTGGSGRPVDAMTPDATVGDGGAGLTGLVCVVADLRAPDLCPVTPTASGVLVRRLGDPAGAISDASGRFTLAVSDPIVTLDVAAGAPALAQTIVPVANSGALIHAPVPTQAAWTATQSAAGVTAGAGNGSIVAYVSAAAGGAAAGVVFDLPPGTPAGPFYDRAGGAWEQGGGTGAAGVAVMIDVPPGVYTLAGADGGGAQLSIAGVPVVADAITFVRGRLPMP